MARLRALGVAASSEASSPEGLSRRLGRSMRVLVPGSTPGIHASQSTERNEHSLWARFRCVRLAALRGEKAVTSYKQCGLGWLGLDRIYFSGTSFFPGTCFAADFAEQRGSINTTWRHRENLNRKFSVDSSLFIPLH